MNRLQQIGIAFDQLINAIFSGMADETISARAWRNHLNKKRWETARVFIDVMFFWQKDHCQNAYASEVNRKHLPYEYRKENI